MPANLAFLLAAFRCVFRRLAARFCSARKATALLTLPLAASSASEAAVAAATEASGRLSPVDSMLNSALAQPAHILELPVHPSGVGTRSVRVAGLAQGELLSSRIYLKHQVLIVGRKSRPGHALLPLPTYIPRQPSAESE